MRLDDRVTISTPEGIEIDIVLAGLGSRFLATMLDTLIQTAAIIALTLVIAAAANTSGDGSSGWGVAGTILVAFLVLFGYHVLFETLGSGRTPGKRSAGIRVVRQDGGPIGFLASVIRNTIRLVDFLPALYGVGIVAIVASARNQRLGDMAAGTLVVREQAGGARAPMGVGYWASSVTVPVEAVSSWDVTSITPDELLVVRHFLDRRLQLPWDARAQLAWELVWRLGPKVAGAPTGAHPEYLLEGIVAAKTARR